MHITEMIEQIQEYQNQLGYDFKFKTLEARMEHARNMALALQLEVAECLDWLPWKPWRPVVDQTLNYKEAAYEIIDIFFFTVNLWLTLGLPPEAFEKLFISKLQENLDRIARGYNGNREDVKTQNA